MMAIHASALARMEELLNRARWFFRLRDEHPRDPAHQIWSYVSAAEDGAIVGSYQEFYCNHEWSSGLDDSDHEIGIRCMICGADGDA